MVTAANGFSGWVVIRRPILRVYEYVEDPMRWHEWVPLYNPVSVATGLASRRFEIDVGMPPFTQREAVEVVDRVPGRSITFQSHRVMPQTATYTFEPTAGGTLVTGLHVPRYWGAVSPWIGFVRPWGEDYLKQGLLQLQGRLESKQFERDVEIVFLCYRRRADRYLSGRICEALARDFGEGSVFRDVDSVGAGSWQDRIKEALTRCLVSLVLINDGWFDDLKSRARKDRPEGRPVNEPDYVLQELVHSLRMSRTKTDATTEGSVVVLPVLSDGAVPRDSSIEKEADVLAATFPEIPELQKLKDQQFFHLRPDPDFRADMEKVIREVWEVVSKAVRPGT